MSQKLDNSQGGGCKWRQAAGSLHCFYVVQRLFLLYSGNILLKEFCALTFATLKLVKSQNEMKKKASRKYQHSAFVQVGGVMKQKINVS